MFVFFCVAAGILAGGLVCCFGMWAFLEGQKVMFRVKSGGVPENIFGSSKNEASQSGELSPDDFSAQLHSLFGSERSEKI